jgi:hypothetical protein
VPRSDNDNNDKTYYQIGQRTVATFSLNWLHFNLICRADLVQGGNAWYNESTPLFGIDGTNDA